MMDYAPLSAACVKSLNDKLYEKRKAAALEVEKMVKEFVTHNNTTQIKRLIKVLGQDLTLNHNPHSRKGGLLGLAAVAVGLGPSHTGNYVKDLIHPILCCFNDSDSRVRYYACESLYNVVKVARKDIIPYFADIFQALSKLCCDTDQSVKVATELLDRLMKDIVTECLEFDIPAFVPLVRERIYTKNSFAKTFLLSWISVLSAVPEFDIIVFLPDILDGLFKILEDTQPDIRKFADNVFIEFMQSIKQNPSRVDFTGMMNILIVHAQSQDESQQLTAIIWLDEFLRLSGSNLLPYTSGIFTAILPCLSYEGDTKKSIKKTANHVNETLLKLLVSKREEENATSETSIADSLDLTSIIEVLTKYLTMQQLSVQTKVAILRWLDHLLKNLPKEMQLHVEELFPVLVEVMGDNSEEVVTKALVVMSELIDHRSTNLEENKYFIKFMVNLLRLFDSDRKLLEDRGSFIIRELCVLLNAEKIFKVLAKTLREEHNLSFASLMVQTLNEILLTCPELFDLRLKLKNLDCEESMDVFIGMYKSWSHNPVCTVSLCFLSQNYDHAYNLVKAFADLEITLELLIEIDKLIQLIESPIFTFMRLELLEPEQNESLIRALCGLLMILPQSDTFLLLQRRLLAIPSAAMNLHMPKKNSIAKKVSKSIRDKINFEELFDHFVSIQKQHHEQKKQEQRNLITSDMSNLNINDG
ncbi:protein VAC14 homolog [Trichogramma pretiosum]|uniref:protein VAC14 homolog n=1 Tax=Trichogramma pretiosum TaxID=7493 RepID=UPI0006C940E2|nr:protein VAC14 homolog [Trichogramma pretiosum]